MIDAVPSTEIVITAERAPEQAADTPASVSIIDGRTIERLGDPLIPSLLRLTPSVSVSTSGPGGSLTEVRIRGSENNHTLLFVDGIRANDPATGNQPRFELLNSDLASRIEVVRGPQSALWGSEAVGGVVAVNGIAAQASSYALGFEGGSFGFLRGSASGSIASEQGDLSAGIGWQKASGIDAFDGNGDKDGYRNLSARVRGSWTLGPGLKFGAAAFSLSGRSEFDGYNPNPPFQHTDTLDSSRNRLSATRLWTEIGETDASWSGRVGGSFLSSRNRNFLDDIELNRTSGTRSALDAQVQHRFRTGDVDHRFILAADHETEDFKARDINFGGATDQDQSRKHSSLTGEWRADAGPISADLAVRHDAFNRFKDATTIRASLLANVGGGFSIAGSYGEGIAQPTFFDLYGFFPNAFVGNPSLRPEYSRGFEGSLRYRKASFGASLTAYRQWLKDEIIDTFDPSTFLSSTDNRKTASRRSGIEAQADWSIGEKLRISANYSYLRASEPNDLGSKVREARRPKHSGAISVDGRIDRFTYGASMAYVGSRIDTDFEVFPYQRVRLGSYWLAGARLGFEVTRGVQLFTRVANAFDANYQDALGYRTEGRSIYGGIRLARGR
ncbi:TonB-dependent receptor plug domain-containing protein [Sphingomonas daechungensis]|uniref:TonB-dependent receptor plug domain-containing protein n=1 Tax=Sphingomonas daechungensis TaxID=1176646 RepID=UPI00378461AF